MISFKDIIKNRRSIRRYKDKKVSTESIREIIQECVYAPSASNEQSWKFIIVNNKDIMKQIAEDAKANLLARIEQNPDDYAKKYQEMLKDPSYNILYNAPSMVFIIGEKDQEFTEINCTLAASYFMISAVSKGLGTCWIYFALAISSKELLATLGIKPNHQIVAPIIIGYPEEIPTAAKRKKLEILKIC